MYCRGSVRRSSMKDKKALSLKSSREEGRWLQDAVMQNDDEDDDAVSRTIVIETTVGQFYQDFVFIYLIIIFSI